MTLASPRSIRRICIAGRSGEFYDKQAANGVEAKWTMAMLPASKGEALTMLERRITFVAVLATLSTAAFTVSEDLKL